MNLGELTIEEFHQGLVTKKFTALEAVQNLFNHIKKTDKKIGAYLSLDEDGAIKSTEEVDIKISKGESISILAGIPMAIKDNILIKNLPATAASRILENYKASYDASVIKKLKEEQAVFIGKTNMDEFAMGSSTENSSFHITHNPHDPKRVPGGSSGGSAAAVASGQALAALGSDTGGSIRQPADFCGLVGLRPTYGAVSRSGLIAMASSLDQIGPIAKTARDAAILARAIYGKDSMDSTSVGLDLGGDILNPKLKDIESITIGLPIEYFPKEINKDISKGLEMVSQEFKNLKVNFKKISLPHTKYAISSYYIILPAEVSANLARFDGIRYSRIKNKESDNLKKLYFSQKTSGFGTETKRRVILGTFVLSSGYYDDYYKKAQQMRAIISKEFEEVFHEVDVILTPTSPTPAFKIGEKIADPLAMYMSDMFTIPSSLAGLPAISIPTGHKTEEGLPTSFQLIGKKWADATILKIGQLYEKTIGTEGKTAF